MKAKIITAALTVVASLGLSLGPVNPAYAAMTCGAGLLCAWDGSNGGGTKWVFSATNYGPGICHALTGPSTSGGGTGNNDWNSVMNRLGTPEDDIYVAMWDSYNCSGDAIMVLQHNLGVSWPTGHQSANKISSFRWEL
jgi:hypothetical protein